MPATNINQLPQDCFIAIRDSGGNTYNIYYSDKNYSFYKINGKNLGSLVIGLSEENPTKLIYGVIGVNSERGFGPLLYDIAMELVNKLTNGKGYLKPASNGVSDAAVNIWDNYFKRSDVNKRPLDSLQNQITPTKIDNVDMDVPKDKYGDNPKLSGPQQPWFNKPLSNGYQKSISNLDSNKILMIQESKIKTIEFILNEGLERFDKQEFRKWAESVSPYGPGESEYENYIQQTIQHYKQKVNDTVLPFNGRIKEILINWLYKSILKSNEYLSEDLGIDSKATEYFQNFLKYSPKFKKESKDINTYKTLADIFKAYKPYKDLENQGFKFDPKTVKDSKIIYEDENYLIMSPLTEQASCELGKNTEWCTAKYKPNDSRNMFNHYTRESPLYILFNKKTGEKTQYHSKTNQMMNENDEMVVNVEFYKLIEKLKLDPSLYEIIPLKNGGIKIERQKNYYKKTIAFYNKNGKLHNLNGPAFIESGYTIEKNWIINDEPIFIFMNDDEPDDFYLKKFDIFRQKYLEQHPEERGLTSEPLEESKIKTIEFIIKGK